jgi:hypothetical protein
MDSLNVPAHRTRAFFGVHVQPVVSAQNAPQSRAGRLELKTVFGLHVHFRLIQIDPHLD